MGQNYAELMDTFSACFRFVQAEICRASRQFREAHLAVVAGTAEKIEKWRRAALGRRRRAKAGRAAHGPPGGGRRRPFTPAGINPGSPDG